METEELWPGGPVLEKSRDAQPVTTDSVLLADFAKKGRGRFLDLGSGSGLISVLLLRQDPARTALLVEKAPPAAALSERNLRLNGLEGRAGVLCVDLRDLEEREAGRFDFVITNPPYFPAHGGKSPDPRRAETRQEESCTLDDVAAAAARLLRSRGRFFLVYPAARLAEAMVTLTLAGLAPKRLRLVQGRADTPPKVFLLECVRNGGAGLTAEPTLLLRDAAGQDTAEARRIYHLNGE